MSFGSEVRLIECKMDDHCMYAELKHFISNQNHSIIIIGDFNLPKIYYNLHLAYNPTAQMLLDFMDDNFLTQLVDKPTRDKKLLHLILVSGPNLVDKNEVKSALGNSDHSTVHFKAAISIAKPIHNNKLVPNYKKANFDSIRSEASKMECKELVSDSYDTNQICIYFSSTYIFQIRKIYS